MDTWRDITNDLLDDLAAAGITANSIEDASVDLDAGIAEYDSLGCREAIDTANISTCTDAWDEALEALSKVADELEELGDK